ALGCHPRRSDSGAIEERDADVRHVVSEGLTLISTQGASHYETHWEYHSHHRRRFRHRSWFGRGAAPTEEPGDYRGAAQGSSHGSRQGKPWNGLGRAEYRRSRKHFSRRHEADSG